MAQTPAALVSVTPEGLPMIHMGGVPVLQGSHVFWQGKWQWSHTQMSVVNRGPVGMNFVGENLGLGLKWVGNVAPDGKQRLKWAWHLEAAADREAVMGGGLSLRFNAAAQALLGMPELLADGEGWRWGQPGGERFEMRFWPKPAALTLEGPELRVWFYKDKIAAGVQVVSAELRAWGNAQVGPDPRREWGTVGPDWSVVRGLAENDWPVDLSFLNAADKPAGRRGFVRAQGDTLVAPDGEPMRFWGTNLTAGALFRTPRAQVALQAKRLAAQGYNLVRLHHHDSVWVNPNVFGTAPVAHTQALDETLARKIDWWIHCLKAEGIYVWLDLHVGRNFTAADLIEGFDEMAKGRAQAEGKGFNYVNPSVEAAMRRFATAYLSRRNTETGLRALDDPAIALVQITNENDLTHHFGNALLPDKKVPWHNARYTEAAQRFAQANGLPRDRVWRSWEPGPAKFFLNDLEHRFHRDAIDHLRGLGLKAIVSSTSTWGGNALSALPALTVGDAVDVHAYDQDGWLGRNPLLAPHLLHWLQANKVTGLPSLVSEWNIEAPAAYDRHTLPLYAAASAAHQSVSAMLHYAYSQGPFANPGGQLSPWEGYVDPAMALTLAPAALIYRRGLVAPASSRWVWRPDANALLGQSASPATALALRTVGEVGHLSVAMPATPALPWLKPSPSSATERRIRDLAASPVDLQAGEIVSDTGELRRSWQRGVATVLTPAVQAFMGRTSPAAWESADVQARLNVPVATLAVVAQDGASLAEAKTWLVTVAGRSGSLNGQWPYTAEHVGGTLRLRSKVSRQVQMARTDGTRHSFVAKAEQGWITLDLGSLPGEGGLLMRWVAPGR